MFCDREGVPEFFRSLSIFWNTRLFEVGERHFSVFFILVSFVVFNSWNSVVPKPELDQRLQSHSHACYGWPWSHCMWILLQSTFSELPTEQPHQIHPPMPRKILKMMMPAVASLMSRSLKIRKWHPMQTLVQFWNPEIQCENVWICVDYCGCFLNFWWIFTHCVIPGPSTECGQFNTPYWISESFKIHLILPL